MSENLESNIPSIEEQQERIRRQIEELSKQQIELEKARLAKIQEEENTKPINIHVTKFDGATVTFSKNDKRRDVTDLLRSTTGHVYQEYYDAHRLGVGVWREFVAKFLALVNTSITYISEDVEKNINKTMNAAAYEIDVEKGKDNLTIKYGLGSDKWSIQSIPGHRYDGNTHLSYIPKLEAWRLAEILADVDGVVWSEEAIAIVVEQTKLRTQIDQIALANEWPEISEKLNGMLNGHKLRPFQEVGVKFIEASNGRAMVVFDVGLGKTPTAVAYSLYRSLQKGKRLKTLIVCPAQLTINWSRQVEKFTGEVPHVVTGTIPNKHDMIEMLASDSKKHFFIANFAVINRKDKGKFEKLNEDGTKTVEELERWPWIDVINLAKFDLLIVDEAHYIKDSESARSIATRKIQTPEVIELTATPVMNKPGEMWPLLKLVAPDKFPSQDKFIRDYTVDGKTTKNMEEFRSLLKTVMIRRRKSEVQKDLPPINRIQDYHTLSNESVGAYQKALAGVYEAITEAGDKWEQEIPNILVQIMRLKQICAIDKIQRVSDLAVELYDGSEGDSHRKVLIFSQFANTPPIVSSLWKRLMPESLHFTGDTPMNERMRIVEQFQNDDNIHFLVVSTKAASEGLDITAAGHVIFHDLMWTPMAHHQAEGRAYGRESDPHSIDSYYVIANDTIEVDIQKLLQQKLDMFGTMVEGVDSARMEESVAKELIESIKRSMWRK